MAHFGAGSLVALPLAIVFNTTGFSEHHPVVSGLALIGLPALVGYLKEKDDEAAGGTFSYQEFGATALGGLAAEGIELSFHW